MKYSARVQLKPNRDTAIRAGHPWVFSGAVAGVEKARRGDIVGVIDSKGDEVGIGTFHPGNSIRVRMISTNSNTSIDADFFANRLKALAECKKRFLPDATDGYRISNADADYLPGLIVDAYASCIVYQIHTAGMEKQKDLVIAGIEALNPDTIIERSDIDARRQDQVMPTRPRVVKGALDGLVEFQEAGVRMLADPLHGQKTGFYLDQREARIMAAAFARGRRVVNLFSYTGGASAAAALAGAARVVSVDTSKSALLAAKEIFKLNDLDPSNSRFDFIETDVFEYLTDLGERGGASATGATHDAAEPGPTLLICDPPAFAKHRDALENAKNAYLRLNRLCLQALKPGDLLLTSSCSGLIDTKTFEGILRHAAGTAGKRVAILRELGAAPDHTKNLAFPEGSYLKTLLLSVTQ
jgi:23S rRNA (cytosine1962-C5)-methyltransferase